MKLGDVFRLTVLMNRGTRGRLVAANVGLTLGVTLVTLFVASGRGLERLLLDDVLGALPITQIKVQPRKVEAMGLRLGTPGGEEGGVAQDVIDELRALDGVRAVYPIAYAAFPVSIRGEVLGSTYGTDAPVMGVDPAWVRGEADPAYGFVVRDDRPVPVLVSRKVLHAYNAAFAGANRLPQLTEGVIVGQPLEIVLGASTLGGTEQGFEVREAVVAGFSDRIDALALAVPIGLVESYARRFGATSSIFNALIVDVRAPDDLPAVELALDERGLEPAPDAYLARQVGQAISLVTLMLSAIGIAVVVLSLLNMANTLALVLRERRYDLGVARALGVSERLLASMLVVESMASGVLSAILALGLSALGLFLGTRALESSIAPLLGTTPAMPVPPVLAATVLVLTPLASALAALPPALGAVSTSVSTALRR